jgi:hypothetical protein
MPDLSLNSLEQSATERENGDSNPRNGPLTLLEATRLTAYLGLNYHDDSAVNQPIDEAFRTQVRTDIRSPRNASGAGRLSAQTAGCQESDCPPINSYQFRNGSSDGWQARSYARRQSSRN